MSWFSRFAGFLLFGLLISVGIIFANSDPDNRRKNQAREVANELSGEPKYPLNDLPTRRVSIPGAKRTVEVYEESREKFSGGWDVVRLRYWDPTLGNNRGCPAYDYLVYVVHGLDESSVAVSGNSDADMTQLFDKDYKRCRNKLMFGTAGPMFLVTVVIPSNNRLTNIRLPGECAFEEGVVGGNRKTNAFSLRSPRNERSNGKFACNRFRWSDGRGWAKI